MSNLIEQRNQLYHQARSAADPSTAQRIWNEADRVEQRMAVERRQEATAWPDDDKDKPYKGQRATEEYRSAFDTYLRRGPRQMSDAEQRALAADNDPAGGYVLLPEATNDKVILAVNNSVVIRQLATVVDVMGAQSIGVPVVVDDPADADWTNELATGSEDSTMDFGKRELHPWPAAKRLKATQKLLLRAKNAEAIIGQRLAYKLSVTFEKGYLTGDGAEKPLGIFTASSQGVSTSRDVSTGNTSTSIGGDGLSNALYSLKERYLNSPSLRWIFHRDGVKQIRQLKDATTGIYYFSPGDMVGQPDRILGVPVVMSEFAPNTFTTGLYVGIVGDFQHYWCADAGTISIQRLNELYIETNQIGFIARFEGDGAPALEEAFARVKLG
jgi:HK97 family phage major capsid protein